MQKAAPLQRRARLFLLREAAYRLFRAGRPLRAVVLRFEFCDIPFVLAHALAHVFAGRFPNGNRRLRAAELVSDKGGFCGKTHGKGDDEQERRGEAYRRGRENDYPFDHARSMCAFFVFMPPNACVFPGKRI